VKTLLLILKVLPIVLKIVQAIERYRLTREAMQEVLDALDANAELMVAHAALARALRPHFRSLRAGPESPPSSDERENYRRSSCAPLSDSRTRLAASCVRKGRKPGERSERIVAIAFLP